MKILNWQQFNENLSQGNQLSLEEINELFDTLRDHGYDIHIDLISIPIPGQYRPKYRISLRSDKKSDLIQSNSKDYTNHLISILEYLKSNYDIEQLGKVEGILLKNGLMRIYDGEEYAYTGDYFITLLGPNTNYTFPEFIQKNNPAFKFENVSNIEAFSTFTWAEIRKVLEIKSRSGTFNGKSMTIKSSKLEELKQFLADDPWSIPQLDFEDNLQEYSLPEFIQDYYQDLEKMLELSPRTHLREKISLEEMIDLIQEKFSDLVQDIEDLYQEQIVDSFQQLELEKVIELFNKEMEDHQPGSFFFPPFKVENSIWKIYFPTLWNRPTSFRPTFDEVYVAEVKKSNSWSELFLKLLRSNWRVNLSENLFKNAEIPLRFEDVKEEVEKVITSYFIKD